METTTDDALRGSGAQAGAGAPLLSTGATLSDRFRIEAVIGRTLWGERYQARDLSDGKSVAVKTLAPRFLADARVAARLETEVALAVGLDHKNVAHTYGLFHSPLDGAWITFVAAESVDGQSLRDMIDKKRSSGRGFSLKSAYNVVAHLCNGLSYAHATTVHGALSPDSVLVSSAGRVKITDFGVARSLRPLERTRLPVGPLPPEMGGALERPERLDARADVYSLGAILFELLVGRPPGDTFERPSSLVGGVPATLDAILERCLRTLPGERYADAQALKEALHAALASELAHDGNAHGDAASLESAHPPAASAPPQSNAPPPRPAAPAPPTPRPPVAAAAARDAAPATPPAAHAPPARAPAARPAHVGSALSAMDDTTERWLIHYDRLDHGPFSMRDVRTQIEDGKILGEYMIIDTETGERRRVRDHGQLRDLVLASETKHAEKARVDQDHADRRKHRATLVRRLTYLMVLVLGVGGFVAYRYKPWEKRVEKVIIKEAADYDFLKGVEINLKVDPPPAVKKKRVPRKGGKPGEFDEVTNLGDASGDGGDETLDQATVQRVMSQNFKVLVGCIAEERRRNPGLHQVDMDFIIKGTGLVSAVKVNGQTGTPVAGCMYGKMQSVTFPKFNGAKTHAAFSLTLK
jgi:serine/threonine-protein kinase